MGAIRAAELIDLADARQRADSIRATFAIWSALKDRIPFPPSLVRSAGGQPRFGERASHPRRVRKTAIFQWLKTGMLQPFIAGAVINAMSASSSTPHGRPPHRPCRQSSYLGKTDRPSPALAPRSRSFPARAGWKRAQTEVRRTTSARVAASCGIVHGVRRHANDPIVFALVFREPATPSISSLP